MFLNFFFLACFALGILKNRFTHHCQTESVVFMEVAEKEVFAVELWLLAVPSKFIDWAAANVWVACSVLGLEAHCLHLLLTAGVRVPVSAQ